MTEENNNKMMVYTVELIKGESGAIRTSGICHVSKDDFLHEAYDIIKCRFVDCRCFEYKGTKYDVWFDDEFLLKGETIYPTLILGDLEPDAFDLICDNFIITKSDEEGKTIGITKEEADDLAAFLRENTQKLLQANAKGLFGGKKSA
ncbi:hypothetical protein SELR_12760 [Selenomonas ruminantium subsp. lactilytica TAM6421]|uniref:DUF3846 domain-containing protein n=1 Tax=Selenomonas ruminantium subsp. lactilytica (strain NBRC 103574 / TAM6421) TaxID=927704 RepID=I0GQE7_SELRL|nr:hypothetical protein [Selenomonas ruminantium]BAL82984.1 hypothetical protein SELR_12760 [Selenomonas ruminantium subsp. lactilytica TAM6421]